MNNTTRPETKTAVLLASIVAVAGLLATGCDRAKLDKQREEDLHRPLHREDTMRITLAAAARTALMISSGYRNLGLSRPTRDARNLLSEKLERRLAHFVLRQEHRLLRTSKRPV